MRPKILLGIFIFLFVALTYRLSYWQIIMAGSLSKDAQNQYKSSSQVVGARGNIMASDGTYLALKSDVWNVFLEKRKVKTSSDEISKKIAPLIDMQEEDLRSQIDKGGNWVSIKNKVDTQIKKNIEALDIAGVGFTLDEGRFYPEASSTAQVLGFLGKNDAGDNVGYFGLEGFYNLPLSGKVGFKGLRKDATGSQIVTENSIEVNAKRGVDLITTIDKRVQLIIEDNLERGISKYGAMGGSVTVIDPMTGDILGMASFPSFDPANYQNYNDALFKNPVITDTFEPGSIFKVLIMAIGLDTGKVEPDTKCDICSEPFKIDKYFIKTWNNKYTDGINMTDVIVHSDNVGMVYVGQKVGQNELFDYLDKFGIGKKTGIDLQGEVALSMRPRGRWSDVDMATTTFGQGIAITGIEMLRAVSVIANGGYSITPRVVKALGGDGWREDLKPSQGERILKEKSAKETALMMVEAVNRGEAQWAKPKGFNNIAGKTGTAQIAVSGQYDEKNTNHSFIGFAPYDKPKFAMLVTLKSPQNSPWAAETAAPLWFAISKELFPYLGVMPD